MPTDAEHHWNTHAGAAPHFVVDTYQDDAVLTFVPTNKVIEGQQAIKRFINANKAEPASSQTNELGNAVKLVKRTAGGDSVVDEVVITILHNKKLPWIIPDIEPTGKTVQIAAVISAQLKGRLVVKKTLYWDQLSVYKQIGVSGAPGIVAEPPVIATPPAEELTANGQPQNQEDRPAYLKMKSNVFSSEPAESFRPSMRLAEGKSHSSSTVFEDAAPETVTARPETVTKNASHFSLGDNSGDHAVEPQKFGRKMDASRAANDSHFSIGQGPPSPTNAVQKQRSEFDPVQRPSSRTAKANQTSSNIFGGDEEAPIRPSSRVLNAPGGQQSFNIFSTDAAESSAPSSMNSSASAPPRDAAGFASERPIHTSSRSARSNQSSFSFGGDSNEPDKVRPSSRVLAQPGGKSNFSLSHDTAAEPAPVRETPTSTPSDAAAGLTGEAPVRGSARTARSNQSSINFGGNDADAIRPSSRVLAAPGGRSNISFG